MRRGREGRGREGRGGERKGEGKGRGGSEGEGECFTSPGGIEGPGVDVT